VAHNAGEAGSSLAEGFNKKVATVGNAYGETRMGKKTAAISKAISENKYVRAGSEKFGKFKKSLGEKVEKMGKFIANNDPNGKIKENSDKQNSANKQKLAAAAEKAVGAATAMQAKMR